MITAEDVAAQAFTAAPASWTVPAEAARAAPLAERLLHLVLFVTMAASSVAFIEPSPHDVLMAAFAVACVVAGVRFERTMLPFFLLLILWNVGGLMSLLNVPSEQKAVQYIATSIYLAIAAILFTCLFAQNSLRRLKTLEAAYAIAALLAAIMGIAGYFHVTARIGELFSPGGRANGTFKDPNVFGPFLILPALFMIGRMVARRVRLLELGMLGVIVFALFLSFSRGAWFHFAVSGAALLGLLFVTAPSHRVRLRIVALSVLGLMALAGILVVALSFESVSSMFAQRAQLIQEYDVGEGGRFRLQEIALGALLNSPNGLGPFEFARIYGLQQHNVYLQAFIVYGWFGGLCYVLMIATTLIAGLRAALVATPWQSYLIAGYAAFVGEVAESFIIDSDHWRHFYLIIGIVWGLTVATVNHQRRPPLPAPLAA